MTDKCAKCGVEFEPKTVKICGDLLKRWYYHVGCRQVVEREGNV